MLVLIGYFSWENKKEQEREGKCWCFSRNTEKELCQGTTFILDNPKLKL